MALDTPRSFQTFSASKRTRSGLGAEAGIHQWAPTHRVQRLSRSCTQSGAPS